MRLSLMRGDALEKADVIFVLAGHRNRKVYAAELFGQGWASSVLMSTTNPAYIAQVLLNDPKTRERCGKAILQDLEGAARQPQPRTGHYFAFADAKRWRVERISAGVFGTLKEVRALGKWLCRTPEAREILVVSAAMHLRRVEACCRKLLPAERSVRMIAVPEEETNREGTKREETRSGAGLAEVRKTMVECGKLSAYAAILVGVRRPRCKE
ncbi:MAG TPA: hypothetical protein VJN93_15430 [Candidatus Acidoferrum sp.]|nr:hypothetical protein [Candidatus Acidoferrum sp.]